MAMNTKNWSTQLKKGYLELCVLSLIQVHQKLYGLQLIKLLNEGGTPMKEGTLYPLLSRMTNDKVLDASWETKQVKGHPRKFYSLSKVGEEALAVMSAEFEQMYFKYKKINEIGERHAESRIRTLSR